MDQFTHRDRCAIAGIGASDFSKASHRTTLTLATEASLAAIADAGLVPTDVDGIVRCDHDVVFHNDLAQSLGLTNLSYWGSTGTGGGAPCGMVAQAVGAIISGQATTVLVFRSLNGRSRLRFDRAKAKPVAVGGEGTYDEFFVPYGLVTPGQMWALLAQRHMHEFGTTAEHLGHIAITCRERANANPAAQMTYQPLTMDDYLAGRMISRPLRLFDYCLETDGACAVIVTSLERARDCPKPPAIIRAAAQGAPTGMQGGMMFPVLMRESLTTQPSAKQAAGRTSIRGPSWNSKSMALFPLPTRLFLWSWTTCRGLDWSVT